MPYVTNPYLISHRSTAVSGQIITTIEMDWNHMSTLDHFFKPTTAKTTAQLFTSSGLQTAEGWEHLLLSVLAHNSVPS